MLNNAFETGCLSDTQKNGLISLICKDTSKQDQLGNWRPISLLNCDYKILSKVLTNRLKHVLPECIHDDQTCAVPGRSIQDNLHLIRNVIDYCNDKDMPAAIVSYDQSKAFDRISHNYLFKVLKAFGFGDSFVKWISLLYTDINSKVIIN